MWRRGSSFVLAWRTNAKQSRKPKTKWETPGLSRGFIFTLCISRMESRSKSTICRFFSTTFWFRFIGIRDPILQQSSPVFNNVVSVRMNRLDLNITLTHESLWTQPLFGFKRRFFQWWRTIENGLSQRSTMQIWGFHFISECQECVPDTSHWFAS